MFKIRIRKSDQLFSKYLREKIGRCEVCHRKDGLQVSHFWGRRHESVRHSEENCDILCFSCHRKFTEDPPLYHDWKFKKLGENRYNLLKIKAQSYCKRDEAIALLYVKSLIKKYDNLEKGEIRS